MLNNFVTYGDVVACEPRYAVVRAPMSSYHNTETGTVMHVYAYMIGCFMCGKISGNPTDVTARYCGYCRMFHENA